MDYTPTTKIKKKNIINLIKAHVDADEERFKQEGYEIASLFHRGGDDELARYVMAILTGANTFRPQSITNMPEYFREYGAPSDLFKVPKSIENDILGIVHAIEKNALVNKFLFVGDSGTGKTEAARQIARILSKKLFFVRFDTIVDSKMGQTAKNLVQVFDDINSLHDPHGVIILFDEIDAIALDRINSRDLREMGRVTSTLLKELDELDERAIIIATSNLMSQFDKALLRRFDFVVDFNRYSRHELEEVAEAILNNETTRYPDMRKDSRIFRKILALSEKLPYPGEMKNIIRSAIAFSDPNNDFGYLAKMYEMLMGSKLSDLGLKDLQKQGFSVREIEKLTGISKSCVSREAHK